MRCIKDARGAAAILEILTNRPRGKVEASPGEFQLSSGLEKLFRVREEMLRNSISEQEGRILFPSFVSSSSPPHSLIPSPTSHTQCPLKDLKTMGGDCLFVLLQVEDFGPILGAAEFEPK